MKHKNLFILTVLSILTVNTAQADIASKIYTDNIANALENQISTKATDTAVVHKTGAETIQGTKTFSDTITSTKSGVVFSAPNATIRSNSNPYFGLFPSGQSSDVKFYLQATGKKLYLGPTSTRALSFEHDNGAIAMPSTLTVQSAISTNTDVPAADDSNRVATTKWTNDKIDDTRSKIRYGSETATDFVEMWVE